MKVVIQVNKQGTDYFMKITNNILNLHKSLADEWTECEVVVFGDGLELVTTEDPVISERRKSLLEKGVRFIVCNNTLTRQNLQVEALSCSVGTAGSGVAHLVRRQAEGWAYLAL
ncbi:DsrE family protein [Bacillus pinisoli]|uniref:DsrE family protein n=1 Tax=Bacillus pinisoli TaxID=2901866 RepID=UPI001FF48F4D|nr:DsrE family protein [Bacillus pinisoli]